MGDIVEVMPTGWLNDVGAKELADLVDPRMIPDRDAVAACLARL